METNAKTKDGGMVQADSREEAFKYQLDMLKTEIDLINEGLTRFDENGRQTKYLAIFAYAGSIGLALGTKDLQKFIILTAIIPLVFWFADARWTNVLRAFVFRLDKIGEFLNSENLMDSFAKRQLVGLTLLDPRGRQYKKTEEYKKTVNLWRSLAYWENSAFYLGLFLISIVAGLFFMLKP